MWKICSPWRSIAGGANAVVGAFLGLISDLLDGPGCEYLGGPKNWCSHVMRDILESA